MSANNLDSYAWSEWFIVRDMGDELLVYDLRSQKITSLNTFAARVWRSWGDLRDPTAIMAALSAPGSASVDLASVENALGLLNDAGLIDRPRSQLPEAGNSRREFFRRAMGAAVTTAAVVSVIAPTPASAASSPCGPCAPPTPYCNWEEECVECLNYEHCVEIGKSFCSNFECY